MTCRTLYKLHHVRSCGPCVDNCVKKRGGHRYSIFQLRAPQLIIPAGHRDLSEMPAPVADTTCDGKRPRTGRQSKRRTGITAVPGNQEQRRNLQLHDDASTR